MFTTVLPFHCGGAKIIQTPEIKLSANDDLFWSPKHDFIFRTEFNMWMEAGKHEYSRQEKRFIQWPIQPN